jgi:hypothetical protein
MAGRKKRVVKRKQAGGAKRKMLKGQGFFDDVGNFFKSSARKVYDGAIRPTYDKVIRPTYDKVLRPGYDFARDNKLISRGLGVAGSFLPGPLGIAAKAGSVGAAMGGLGRHRMRGSGQERMFGCAVSN